MATQANVTLRFLMSGANSIVGIMDRISGKKRDLERPVDIPITADKTEAQRKFDEVKAELADLNKQSANPKLDARDAAGKVKVAEFKIELRKLNDYVARPTISERGLARTELRLLKLKHQLEGLDKGGFSFGSLFQGVSGVGAGASAAVIKGITSPVGAAATAAALPFAATGIGGGIIGAAGAGLAGLGIAGALGAGNKSSAGQLSQAQGALSAAQLRVTASQERLNKLQNSGKASADQLTRAHASLASAEASVAGAQERLSKVKQGGIKQDNAATNALENLEGQVRKSLASIGQSFVPVLASIFGAFNSVLQKMTPVFAAAEQRISGPFKQMGVVLAQSLGSPQMSKSIGAVAEAFAQFLKVFTPQIPGIINSLAGGITGIATAFTDHPGMITGMANVLDFLLKLPGYVMSAIGAMVRVTSWLTSGFPHMVSIGLDAARTWFVNVGRDIRGIWDTVFGALRSTVSTVLGWLSSHWKLIVGILLGPIIIVPALIVKYWNDIKAPFVAGFNFIVGIYRSIMNWITGNFDKWWAANGEAVKIIWRNVWSQTLIIFHRFWDPIVLVVRASWATILSIFQVGMGIVRGVMQVGWGILRGLFVGGMQAVKLVWQVGWAAIRGVLSIMWTNIQAFVRIGWAVITLIFKSSIGILVASWRIFWSVISNVAKVVWTVVKNTIKGIWDIIVGLFTIFINVVTGRWGAALNAMKNLGTQIWNLTKNNLQAIWNAIRNIGIAIWNALRAYLVGLWNNTKTAAISIWNAVKGAIVNIWNTLVSTGKSIWNSFFGWLRQGWHNVVSSASTIWNGIKNAVMAPVRWVVNNVWDPFAGIINKATSFLHLGNPLPVVHLASGGIVPQMVPGSGDRQPALLEAGETVIDKRRSKQYSDIFAAMGVPGFQGGGRVGGPPGSGFNLHTGVSNSVGAGPGIKDIVNVGKTLVGFGAKLVQGAVLGVLKPAVNGILSGLSHMPGLNSPFGHIIAGIPKAIANAFFNFIGGKDKAFNATAAKVPNVGSGVARWAGLVVKALQMEGLSTGLAKQVLYQMATESGGNPNAINMTDINAQHGDPSRGLLQTIMSTFRAYHWPGTSNNIYDPLANIAAAINYARHVYGPSLMRGGMGMGSGHGYARGTDGAEAGWAWVGEEGPELVRFSGGEEVIPHQKRGYATGTRKRRVTRIPASEINTGVSLDLAFMHGDLMTVAKLQAEQRTYLRAISRYYNGKPLAWRDAMVNRQVKAMEAASAKLSTLQKSYATAKSYASSVTSNLSGYASLSNIDLNSGLGIAGGIKNKLSRLTAFASMLTKLRRRGVSTAIISQIIGMGPDDGYQYAAALVGATGATIRAVNQAESQIGSVSRAVGRSAALAVYGIDIAKGLGSQERQLKAMMHRLGRELGREALAWFHVPKGKVPRGYASGTLNASRGWAWVGENGPEMMYFGGGEAVIPPGRVRGGDGSSAVIIENLNVNFRGQPVHTKSEIGRAVKEAIEYAERHGN